MQGSWFRPFVLLAALCLLTSLGCSAPWCRQCKLNPRNWNMGGEGFPESHKEMTAGIRPSDPGLKFTSPSRKGREIEQSLGAN